MAKMIPLSNYNGVIIVDDEDFERAVKEKWYIVIQTSKCKSVRSFIMGTNRIQYTNRNKNPFDCRKDNLKPINGPRQPLLSFGRKSSNPQKTESGK